MHKQNLTDVLIVGAGPVGLTLAAFLQQNGVNFRIIDKRPRQTHLKRAIAVSTTTLLTFKELSIVDELIEKGKKISSLTLHWENKRIAKIDYSKFNVDFPFFLHVYQPQTESILVNHLAKKNNQVEHLVSLDSIEQNEDFSIVRLVNQDNHIENVYCKYIVACDGGNSFVREITGVEVDSAHYDCRFELADVKLDWDERKNNIQYYINDEGYLMVVPGSDGYHRIIISNQGINCPREITLEMVQSWVDRRGPGNIKIQSIEWFASVPFGHKIAKHMPSSSIFLAGDAYHQFSPVGGINMNIGIQDAHNLGLKLAAVINKKSDAKLLDHYEKERRIVINSTLAESRDRTYTITRSPLARQSNDRAFIPSFCNRKLLRENLPFAISGLSYAHDAHKLVSLQ